MSAPASGAHQLRLGIFSNQQRHRTDVTSSWEEDLQEIVCADGLGYTEAWVSEHAGLRYLQDGLALPDYLICAAAARTRQIRLGPGVRILPLHRPLEVAVQVSTCDHLTGGRYMFGFGRGGPGGPENNPWTARGIHYGDTAEMALEAADLIATALSAEEPFDWRGRCYAMDAVEVYPKPIQRPFPPVAIASATPASIRFAAERGWRLLMSQYARPEAMRRHAKVFCAASAAAGLGERRHDVVAVRAVFVADTDELALAQLAPGWREHLEFNKRHFGAVFTEWLPPGGLDELSFEHLVAEGLVLVGSPATVGRQVNELYRASGGFGTLLLVTGKDWGTFEQRARSLELMIDVVLPQLQEDLCTAST